jgi:single-strand DNA-binding protein
MDTEPDSGPANVVQLRGVLAAPAVSRILPSGDELISFRVTVARPPGDRVRVDSIDCASTKASVRRTASRFQAGDVVEVAGSLHRRFWRSPAGSPASRYEVEVGTVRRCRRAGAATG